MSLTIQPKTDAQAGQAPTAANKVTAEEFNQVVGAVSALANPFTSQLAAAVSAAWEAAEKPNRLGSVPDGSAAGMDFICNVRPATPYFVRFTCIYGPEGALLWLYTDFNY